MADTTLIKLCLKCGADVSAEMNKLYRVELEPCGCVFCLHCLSEMEASRGHSTLQCPIHQWVVVSHRYWKLPAKKHLTRSGGKRPRNHDDAESSDCDDLEPRRIKHIASEYHAVIDAFRLWLKELIAMGGDDMRDFVGNGLLVNIMYKVSLSDDMELDMQKLMYVLSANAEFIPSQHNQRIYIDSNRWLHSAIFPLSYTPEVEVDLLTPNDVLNHMVKVDARILGKGIFGFMTGRLPFEDINIMNAGHQAQVYIAAICQDLMVRAVDPRKDIGHTVNVLSFQVEKSQPTQLIELLARMRLIKSRTTLAYDTARRALDSMRERVDLGTHGIVASSGDNVNWKDQQGGFYEQTAMLVHNPHISRLPYNQDPPRSRDRTVWRMWKRGKMPEKINKQVFLPRMDDYHVIGEQMFTQIGAVLENLTSMPWGTEACEALCSPPYRYHTDKKIPNFWRLCQRSDLGRIRTGKEEIVNTTVETIWERNDLHACPIQDIHFGTLATMHGIVEALNLQGADQLAAFEEALQNGLVMPSQEKPISNDSVFFSADGAMAEMMGRMLDADSNTLDRKYKKLVINPGAFHW